MENNTNIIEPLISRVEDFGKTSLELIKLQAIERSSKIASSTVANGIFFWVFNLCIVLLNIGAALWLGEITGKIYLGFIFLAGFYAFLTLIFYFFVLGYVKKCVAESFISKFIIK